ncbi:MAG: LamG-like jellyroll fold domain-containing protein [Pseudomonadota bacterium]
MTYTVSDDRFEVVDGVVQLVDGVSLDHEEVASIELTVTATDSGGLSTEETFTIDVLDVNEGPSDLALDGSSVSENDAGAVIGTLSSFDPDDGDSVTYTVSDDRFEVVDGQVRLVDGVSLDHEDAAFIELTVTATDSGGLSTEETFTIDVLDVNEGPSDLSLDGSSVSENDTGAVIGTLSSFDPDDGDSVTYTVSDDRFEIVDGQVRLVDGVSLDHEEAGSIDLTVTATDSGGLSTEETFTIDVLDVNEGPSDLTLDNTTVAENDAGAVIGTLSSFDPDDGDSVNYTVSDDRFEVVDGVVRLVDGVSLDHEEAASIELTVTATDSSGLSTEETFTIDVLDVNEGPSDLTLDNATLAENDPGAVIGTLSSFDPDAGDTITYTVSDDRFEVIDGQVRLVDGVSLDHEAAASIDLTVTATDRGGLSTDETFTIDVIDVNEGPSDLTLDNTTVAENDPGAVVGTLSSFDPDAGDTVTYTVSDDRFEVVDGVVRLADGVSLDHEQIEAIDISITATDADGASITEDFTISVADVNEAPFDLTLNRETGIAEADFSANDGHTGDSVERLGLETDGIVFTMSFTTSGDVSTTQTLFETGGSVYGTNVVIEDGMLLIYAGEGNDVELSIPIDGDTNYSFALELDTTNNTIRVLLSDELPLDQMTAENSLVATLTDWTDRDYTGSNQMGVGRVGGGSSQGRIGGEFLGEIDEPGLQVFSDSALEDVFTEIGIAENTEGAVVGTLTVSDPDAGDTITYTVSDDRFEIVDGVLQLAQGVTLDYEQASTIDVTVTATDSGGLTTNETFTVNVIDLNEAPTDLQAENTTVDENTAEGIIGTIAVSDPDAGDTHTFRLVDGDDGPFAVDPETGEISIVTPGMPDDSVLRIDASDVDSLTLDTGVSAIQDLSEQGNTIRQTDADERPDLTNDGPFGGPGLQFDGVNDRLDISDDRSLNLSSQSERSFALTIRTGEDVDSRQVIFEEGGTVNGFNFYIDDGQLYMGAWSDSNGWSFEAITIDIEPGESYSIVTVFDGASNTYTAYVNGEQVGAVEVGDAMSAHSGNIGLGGIAQHTVFHDGASSANDGFYFEGSIGEFAMYNDALSNSEAAGIDMDFRGIEPVIDFETRDSYDLTVEVTDAAGETYQDVITINVNDLNERPSELALDGSSASENDAGAVVGTLSSFDPDVGDSVTYTVSDDRFEVVDGVVQLVDGVSLDHEEAASIELTVTATDSGGLSTEETFTIDVLDVNEGPSDLTLDNPTVAENDSGAVIGTLSSFDPDAGDTITYTVSDDRFEVVDGVVRLVDGVSLDHEAAASIDLTVTATDSGGLSTEETFTIDVLDVNEGPSDLALDGSSVSENDAGAVVGTLSSFDPDDGDSVTYMVSDDRFEVVDGQVRLVDGVSLDHEDAASIELTVTATDSGGLSTEETFAIDVIDVNEGPSDLSLDGSTVSENDAGAVIGTLSSFDPDDGDSVTYTVSDDRFEVIDGQVRLVDGVSLDHEEAASIGLTITATDSNGLSTEDALTIDVLDVNEGPGDLTLDNTSVAENDAGAVVGTLSSFDPDAGDTILYTVSDDRFEVVDGQVRLVDGVSLDHEEAASIELTITATDSGGLSTEETFTIDVTDINEAPSDIVLTPYAGALSLNQDGGHDDNAIAANMTDFPTDAITVEITFTADGMPAGSGAPLFSYSAGGNWGNDVLLWAESSTGRLSVFLDGQKFQTDIANADLFDGDEHTVSFTWDQDTGELIVYVDGEAEYSQFVNVSELPSDGTVVLGQEQDREGGGYDENQIFEGEISDVRIYDEALSDDAIAGNASGQISADGLVTHWQMEGAENGVIQDQVGDNDLILENDARITNTADAGSPSVAENVEGAIIGLVSSMDPDAGDTVSYTVSDDRFEVVDGVLRLADGVSLDHEQAASIELTVTATDGADLSSSETFTIAVLDQNEAPIDLTITAASDNLVTGGSFEEQDVRTGGWRGFGSDTSGNWDSANGIEVWDNLGGVAASEGNQFLELDYTHAADAISQTVSTEAGQTYILSFDMRARGSSTTDMIEVYWNGELVGSVDPASTRWEEVSFEVTGTGMGDVLEFREADGESDSLGAHLDNIALVEVPMTLVENDAGAVVGTVSVYDPDAGDQVIYTVSDDRFEIVDGVLQLKAGVSLDYEAEAAVELTVTATDEAGLETSETITIDVLDLAEDVALADGGDTYVESGKTESSVTGGDGDDVITGGPGDDVLRGGDGNDLFIYAENGGSDTIDGGAGWTDTLDLTAALGEDAVYGEDWTITVTDGEIVSEDAVSIELSEDASGYITLGNGETIEFANLEQVGF